MLRQEAALYIASDPDFRRLPFNDEQDSWTVGNLVTKSRIRAVYRHALAGEEIRAAPHNRTSSQLTPEEDLVVRWFRAARHASQEQLVEATGLAEYDVGRIGFQTAWGIQPEEAWVLNLENLVGA